VVHPFRFVAQVPNPLVDGPPGAAWSESARRVEGLGYHGLSLPDHLGPQLAPLVALAHAAAVTTTLRFGTTVLAVDLRHPAMLAKEVATLDVLSDGRVDLGIGAGWMTADYATTGIPMAGAGVRIERLAEAVAILRGLWADGPCTFAGTHFTVTALDGRPKPVQRPGPPITLGGGARRILTLAGRLGDVVNIGLDNREGVQGADAGRSGIGDAMAERLAWVRAGAEQRVDGRTFADLRLGVRVLAVHVGDVDDDRAAEIAGPLGWSGEELRATPHALVGPVDAIVDALVERRERWGLATVVVSAAAVEPLAPVVARLSGT
jgi:probable F420-dependent oxidoreductase